MLDLFRMLFAEVLGEPALQHHRRNAIEAFLLHVPDTLVPHLGAADLRADIGEDGATDSLRRMGKKP
ncbi:hypothetical protein MHY1_03320 [Methylovirgula sp. HY1]|nr:hypothetical protein MHY1_03320 [Methylovirgula sp. HY1]